MLGICGTAMTALAGCLQALGARVTGSDQNVYPPMSDQLAALGIPLFEGYRASNIPVDTELVVVGNVIQEQNPEAAEMRHRNLPHVSMAEAVKRYAIGDRHTIAVVGTHGKTTTTSLVAHLLTGLGEDPGFLVGGIAGNFGANFHLGQGGRFVIEGDEYDTAYFDKTPKFFKYAPDTVLFTSLEFDHADIYKDLDAIRVHFEALLAGLPKEGGLIACVDDPNVRALLPRAPCPVVGYGFDGATGEEGGPDDIALLSDWSDDGSESAFTLAHQGAAVRWRQRQPGRHNALNAAAAILLARSLGYEDAAIQRVLLDFAGVRRRQEVRGVAGGVTVIDDFAHHPTAVRLTIEAMRHRYPGQRLWAVLEPRSFTARGARFQNEFTEALAGAERVLIARPLASAYSGIQTPGEWAPLDTGAMVAKLNARGVQALNPEDTEEILAVLSGETAPGDVVLIMSNGGFDDIHNRLLDALGGVRADEPETGQSTSEATSGPT